MDRNALIGLFLILLVWMYFLPKNQPVQTEQPAVQGSIAQTGQPAGASAIGAATETALKPVQKALLPETFQTLENENLKLTLSSRKAALSDIVLKNYKAEKKTESTSVHLNRPDAVEANAALFSLWSKSQVEGAQEITGALNEFREVSGSAQPREVSYVMNVEEAGQPALRLTQTYRLNEKGYDMDAQVRIANISKNLTQRRQIGVSWQTPLTEQKSYGIFSAFVPPPDFWHALALVDDKKLENIKLKSSEVKETSGAISWASLGNRYFLMALIPNWEGGRQLRTSQETATQGNLTRISVKQTLWTQQLTLAPGEETTLSYRVFLGPKEQTLLDAQGHHLNRALDLGMFEFFAIYLLRLLRLFHSFLGNWGLAIISLTVLVKIIFYPLTQKSFRSMKEMQRIQPLIEKLKQKYGDNKEQMNVEMMKLWKEHKVNPLGGCLPMVIQMPIWIALYRVLFSSIEMRHAPFYLWIQDLSTRDPFFVTPILLGFLMFLQQRLSPKPPDPAQAKMMMIMPVMFTGFMLFVPSGLVIYIISNTVISILQQWHINRSLGLKTSVAGILEPNGA